MPMGFCYRFNERKHRFNKNEIGNNTNDNYLF